LITLPRRTGQRKGSSLVASMGRFTAHTGQLVTFHQMMITITSSRPM
jgi:hypothetical protein